MIDVVIAEDEIVAREQIKLLIGRYPGFRVIGEAGDGNTAAEIVRALKPDLLFTDIRMPGKNGLELLDDVRKSCPSVELVVISGYSDFDYVKGALQNGCRDYLLKPISPKQFRSMMERLEEVIDTRQMEARNHIFEDIVREAEIEEQRLKKYFTMEKYHISLVRELGLPGAGVKIGGLTISSEMKELNCIYGRDAKEALYLWPEELSGIRAIEQKFEKSGFGDGNGNTKGGYFTMISYTEGIRVSEIPQKVRSMYEALNRHLVLGKTQYFRMERLPAGTAEKRADFDRKQLFYFIQHREWENIEKEIKRVLKQYEKDAYPLYKLKTAVNHLVADLFRELGREPEDQSPLDEAYCYAKNMDELGVTLLDYLKDSFWEKAPSGEKIDTADYFERVLTHVKEHLQQPMSLQTLSAYFGISSSYMSRLFKKYAGIPFNEYLTRIRIERAQELFRENPDYFVKDVSELVGISDQFYFSRLFRSITGKTPTRFGKECKENHI